MNMHGVKAMKDMKDVEEYCHFCAKITTQRVRWCLNMDNSESLIQFCTLCLTDKDTATKNYRHGQYVGERD